MSVLFPCSVPSSSCMEMEKGKRSYGGEQRRRDPWRCGDDKFSIESRASSTGIRSLSMAKAKAVTGLRVKSTELIPTFDLYHSGFL